VHIPGPKAPADDANAAGLRPIKAPVPWRVRRTAPGAARTSAMQTGGQTNDGPKADNSALYYKIILMMIVIGVGTYLALRLFQ
jgi:hypothetical protein